MSERSDQREPEDKQWRGDFDRRTWAWQRARDLAATARAALQGMLYARRVDLNDKLIEQYVDYAFQLAVRLQEKLDPLTKPSDGGTDAR